MRSSGSRVISFQCIETQSVASGRLLGVDREHGLEMLPRLVALTRLTGTMRFGKVELNVAGHAGDLRLAG